MPKVSIIVPCFNEEATIVLLLHALYKQDFPRDDMEVIIADGLSTDGTRQKVNEFMQAYNDLNIQIVDNPKRIIPAGLNKAIECVSGEYIIRLDAHSIPDDDYVSKCVSVLDGNFGANVGGLWRIKPGEDTWIATSIALAAAHPLGAGDARYRLGGSAQTVDTIPFGAYRRSLIAQIGPYDENLETNEDYEFNARIRRSGGIIWFEPAIQSTYIARSTINALARQYWRYGYWKTRMLRKFPSTLRWRQLLPPAFILSLLSFAILSPFNMWVKIVFLLEIGIYLFSLLIAGIQLACKKRAPELVIGIPMALVVMHIFWGSSFLWGVLNLFKRNVYSS